MQEFNDQFRIGAADAECVTAEMREWNLRNSRDDRSVILALSARQLLADLADIGSVNRVSRADRNFFTHPVLVQESCG